MAGLKTTCIGAYPKPDYVPILDWFDSREGDQDMTTTRATESYQARLNEAGNEAEALFVKAAAEVINDQISCGIDVPTDGEVRRENYIHYHCRNLKGIDFEHLTEKLARDGAATMKLPTVVDRVSAKTAHFLPHDFKVAQQHSKQPVKVTIPGPLTIADTTADVAYHDLKALCRDLADAINYEVKALADAGCLYIQIDEPIFARQPEHALAFGIENLERCFHGVGKETTRVMHMCCGYPNYLDETGYKKADQNAYQQIASTLDEAAVDQVSIEDAHRYNDLSLLEHFVTSTVIFGSFTVASSEVESSEQIRERLLRALDHIDRERLWVAPDCGLGLLGRELAMQKLTNMCKAARSV